MIQTGREKVQEKSCESRDRENDSETVRQRDRENECHKERE